MDAGGSDDIGDIDIVTLQHLVIVREREAAMFLRDFRASFFVQITHGGEPRALSLRNSLGARSAHAQANDSESNGVAHGEYLEGAMEWWSGGAKRDA